MRNEYHKDVMDLLLECGKDGMNVHDIARRIYNKHAGLFTTDVVFDVIYNQVRGYLWSQSTQKRSPFIRLSWGQYAIKPDFAVQLDFILELYRDEDMEESIRSAECPQDESNQLTLF